MRYVTPNLNLIKPDKKTGLSIEDLNSNSDLIDYAIKNIQDQLALIRLDSANIGINRPSQIISSSEDAGKILATNEDGSTSWVDTLSTIPDDSIEAQKIDSALISILENNYVTPEMYGASGDGQTNDLDAFVQLFSSGKNIFIPNKVYKIDGTSLNSGADILKLTNLSNGFVYCCGTLNFVAAGSKPLTCVLVSNCPNTSIIGLTINGNSSHYRGIEIWNSQNMILDNCRVLDIGNSNLPVTCGIFVRDNSAGITIRNTQVRNIISSAVSTGIDFEASSPEVFPCHALIDHCTIKNVSPIEDSDGVKVLNSDDNTLVDITVRNSYFYNCEKRALKFQARGCYSENNTMEWSVLGFNPIAFHRGYCHSIGDKIISTRNVTSSTEDIGYGFFRSYITMAGDYNECRNLTISVPEMPEWFTPTAYNGLVNFSGGRAIDGNTNSHNLIDGVYGNGLANSLIVASAGDRNIVGENNKIINFKFRVASYLIVSADYASSGFKYELYKSKIDGDLAGFNTAADIRNLYLPNSWETAAFHILNCELTFRLSTSGKATSVAHQYNLDDNLLFRQNCITSHGSRYQSHNIQSEIVYDKYGSLPIVSITQVQFTGSRSPQESETDSFATDFDWYKLAQVGDTCINRNGYQKDSVGIWRKWICTEAPTAEHKYGKWEKLYVYKA